MEHCIDVVLAGHCLVALLLLRIALLAATYNWRALVFYRRRISNSRCSVAQFQEFLAQREHLRTATLVAQSGFDVVLG